MSTEPETPSGKKHRVIHWNPEAGREQSRRRWTFGRIVLWGVGGFVGLLAIAAVITRTIKFVNPDAFSSLSPQAGVAAKEDLNTTFTNQSKATLAHDQAKKNLDLLGKLPNEHPRQRTDLILIQKEFNAATEVLRAGRFAEAFTLFESLSAKMDEFSQSVQAKKDSQTGLSGIMVRLEQLKIAKDLAPQEIEAAYTEAARAQQFIAEGSFLLAMRSIETGNAKLQEAENALGAYVTSNLQKGQQAILRGEKDAATGFFHAALEKSPGNEAAVTGLKRAETADRVYALLAQAKAQEDGTRYAEAAESYKKAFDLDNLSAAAQQGQARAARLDRETRFNAAFSTAQAAYNRRDWEVVMTQGRAALQVEPENAQVLGMLTSAREESHKDAVGRAFTRAEAHTAEYRWAEAQLAYDEVLKLEPAHADAKAGYIQAGEMIRTLQRYNARIDRAETLAEQGEFQSAITIWNDAMAAKPQYLAANDRVVKLKALLESQSKAVPITLTSDGNTTVSIINSASLQPTKFKGAKTVELLPGNYQVLGNRRNFRDFRLELKVRAGQPIPVINAVCTEPVRG